jgi:hypothetical protein
MVLFLFTGMRASQILVSELDPHHRPKAWMGTYEDLLPYLNHAFSLNVATVRSSFPDATLGEEIVDVFQQMCDPNIATRGDRLHKAKYGSRFSLERIVQRFDRLRRAAILGRFRHP